MKDNSSLQIAAELHLFLLMCAILDKVCTVVASGFRIFFFWGGVHILEGKIEYQEIPPPIFKIFDSLGFFPGYTPNENFP